MVAWLLYLPVAKTDNKAKKVLKCVYQFRVTCWLVGFLSSNTARQSRVTSRDAVFRRSELRAKTQPRIIWLETFLLRLSRDEDAIKAFCIQVHVRFDTGPQLE